MGTLAASPDSSRHRNSYRKTTVLALGTMVACAALFFVSSLLLQPPWLHLVRAMLVALLLMSALIFCGGMLVLYRHALELKQMPDLFFREFSRVPADSFRGLRRWLRPLLGSALRPGDLVEVRNAAEIGATLDERGRLAELPFMPEMLPSCGRVYRVARRVDKINDWRGGNEIRRVRNVVTLVDVRCSGIDHGGCEAGCHILWNERWLRRVSRAEIDRIRSIGEVGGERCNTGHDVAKAVGTLARMSREEVRGDGETRSRYICQLTELPRASSPMRTWDVRQDLRPLLSGNIGVVGFLTAVLTSLFNKMQSLRGGVPYPVTAPQLESGPTPVAHLNLQPGEFVRVRSKFDIGRTLVKNHNRGMWFGTETVRHCGQPYRVLSRVTRIIDERSGEMKEMKTPGIVLNGVTGTGEFLRFCPQNEYVFWREIWLERVGPVMRMATVVGRRGPRLSEST